MLLLVAVIVGYIIGKYFYPKRKAAAKEPQEPFVISFPKKDTRPIHEKHDLTKDSEYYKRTFPQYLDPEHPDYVNPVPEAPREEKPRIIIENLTVNVTHNHLHITNEEK
ncbi:hypothetical protein [Salinimicrobium sp. GXAS 041]|uniref:hypothetical protein n=1 Tax=Salinimicrobium sp. GXAS 041 TaxID=3400806 RepID=UPI003C72E8DE